MGSVKYVTGCMLWLTFLIHMSHSENRNCSNPKTLIGPKSPLYHCAYLAGSIRIVESSFKNMIQFSHLIMLGFPMYSSGGKLILVRNQQLINLHGLEKVVVIDRDLIVRENGKLRSLNGFFNLTHIGGNVAIVGNDKLVKLMILNKDSKLATIGGQLSIINNNALREINGFSNLSGLGSLWIENNDKLGSIDGFSRLTEIKGHFLIKTNSALKMINGFSNIGLILGDLQIMLNEALTNLNGFYVLREVVGLVMIADNSALIEIDALYGLTFVRGGVEIQSNSNLKLINKIFLSVEYIGEDISIDYNAALPEIPDTSFNKLLFLGGSLNIVNNKGMQSLKKCFIGLTLIYGSVEISNNYAMDHITDEFIWALEIGGHVNIFDNYNLLAISIFPSVISINGSIQIEGNDKLKEFEGFFNLEEIGGDLHIASNKALRIIDAFDFLRYVYGNLRIVGNPAVRRLDAFFNLLSVKDYFEISGTNLTDIIFRDLYAVEGLYIDNNTQLVSVTLCSFDAETDPVIGSPKIQCVFTRTKYYGTCNANETCKKAKVLKPKGAPAWEVIVISVSILVTFLLCGIFYKYILVPKINSQNMNYNDLPTEMFASINTDA